MHLIFITDRCHSICKLTMDACNLQRRRYGLKKVDSIKEWIKTIPFITQIHACESSVKF